MKNNTTAVKQLKCVGIFILIMLPLLFAAVSFVDFSVLFFSLNFLSGILIWTYFEYHFHRFITHNKAQGLTQLVFKRHIHHHKHPTEIRVTSKHRIVLFLMSSLLFLAATHWNNYFTIVTGVAIGFSYSFFSHWMLHQTWSKKVFPHLHRFHIHHHCKYPDRCFGFSTIFWDLVFKTKPPKNAVITEKIIKFYYSHH